MSRPKKSLKRYNHQLCQVKAKLFKQIDKLAEDGKKQIDNQFNLKA